VAEGKWLFWQRQFGGRPDAIGPVIKLDEYAFTVVGVLPKAAVFPGDADMWMPLGRYFLNDDARLYSGLGQLKRGIRIEQARADLMRIHKNLVAPRPENQNTEPTVMPLAEHYVGSFRLVTQVLLGGVGFVLLVACVNVC